MTNTEALTTKPVAIVTGGGSGIGRATVLRLLADNYRVVVADLNVDGASETVKLADAAFESGRVIAVRTDVRCEEDIAAMIAAATDGFGRLDTLVNNAGVGGAFGPVSEVQAPDWDFTFDVLVRAVFLGIKHASKVMEDGASIVNVASAAAYSGCFAPMAYTAAKAAVLSLTRSAAVELAPRLIRVNAVCPGAVRTPLLEAGRGEELDALLPLAQPLPRWGRPEDIADAIVYLAGPGAAFVTGESLVVDGGLVAAGPGPDFQSHLGTDPRKRGLTGVNRGTSGERSVVHSRAQ
ncbi:short-chain dehydrogenase [Rhodococcus sp. ACS1]|nr:short-chain dehydrogenase [Rhodococcus sp. ACS1]